MFLLTSYLATIKRYRNYINKFIQWKFQLAIKHKTTMKFVAIILTIFLVIFALHTVEASVGIVRDFPDFRCEVGMRWQEDCNDCFCDEGNIEVCTEMACGAPVS